tara:strand:+ start:1322 stop:2221 length:900 start_codon:yes stop_codon:yes gene_type:complete
MGLLDNQSPQVYYEGEDLSGSGENLGTYQFTSMDNIISAFMITHVGESKILPKVDRSEVQFHAMRAIQELSYDVFRSVKSQEIEVPPSLTMRLPQDYVNYVKVVRVDSNGIERILYPTGKTSNPFALQQNADGSYIYPGNAPTTSINEQSPSNTLTNYQNQTVPDAYSDDTTDIEIDSRGRRYGLDPQYAQANGTFYIDYLRGNIHFGSSLAGQTITLKYISDSLGTDSEMHVHKFCEEACYKWIACGLLSTRSNIPPYIMQRFKKEKFAETRKAKIRLSNIKIEEFTQVLKGLSKPIK